MPGNGTIDTTGHRPLGVRQFNVYRIHDRIELCVDLVGIDRKSIDLRIEPGLVTLCGVRGTPKPPRRDGETLKIINMEIDHGPFCRKIRLPGKIDLARAENQHVDGPLRIRMPLSEAV